MFTVRPHFLQKVFLWEKVGLCERERESARHYPFVFAFHFVEMFSPHFPARSVELCENLPKLRRLTVLSVLLLLQLLRCARLQAVGNEGVGVKTIKGCSGCYNAHLRPSSTFFFLLLPVTCGNHRRYVVNTWALCRALHRLHPWPVSSLRPSSATILWCQSFLVPELVQRVRSYTYHLRLILWVVNKPIVRTYYFLRRSLSIMVSNTCQVIE